MIIRSRIPSSWHRKARCSALSFLAWSQVKDFVFLFALHALMVFHSYMLFPHLISYSHPSRQSKRVESKSTSVNAPWKCPQLPLLERQLLNMLETPTDHPWGTRQSLHVATHAVNERKLLHRNIQPGREPMMLPSSSVFAWPSSCL
jgi:hypothetical protein